MSKARFDKAFARFLAGGQEQISPKSFFQVLDEIERHRPQRTIELRARIVGRRLRFEPSDALPVNGNTIFIGDKRIIVQVS